MVDKYVKHITEGTFLWTKVPNAWNKKVQDELIALGYTLNKDGTVTKKDE